MVQPTDGTLIKERGEISSAIQSLPSANSSEEVYSLSEIHYTKKLNAATEMVDRHVEKGRGENVAVHFENREIRYAELREQVDRLGNALLDLGVESGDRVFIRFPNRPKYIVSCLAIQKIGAIPVPSMKLLQTEEIEYVLDDSGARFAIIYDELLEPVDNATATGLEEIIVVENNDITHDYRSYSELLSGASADAVVSETHRDDIALLAYTSGTTGQPKGTVHTHRQLLSITDTYARHCLSPSTEDVFGGNPPLAFTFGYGFLAAFPLRFGASACLIEDATPEKILSGVEQYGITVLGSVPTAYNQMLSEKNNSATEYDLSSLRIGVSAGEPLTPDTYNRAKEDLGIKLLDGIGTTEMLHIFISHTVDDAVDPSVTGYPVPGYECKVVDAETGEELDRGEPGLLMVRGPTGVSYWNRPEIQEESVRDGWSIPGDIFVHHENGSFEHKCRSDDLIITSGYNVPGPQIEKVLQECDAVKETAVVGSPDDTRGTIVKAFVILEEDSPSPETTNRLQNHVKNRIAPYKYPRDIEYVDELPMTESGKIQRNLLRERERE